MPPSLSATRPLLTCCPAPPPPPADIRCGKWAAGGECEKNQGFMYDSCPLACKVGWAGPWGWWELAQGTAPLGWDGRLQPLERQHATPGALAHACLPRSPPPLQRCTPKPKKGVLATAAAADVKAREEAAAAAAGGHAKPQLQHEVADSQGRVRGGDAAAVATAARALRLRCNGHPEWSLDQVRECLRLASQGKEYRPAGADAGVLQAAAGADAAAAERGERQEQQLHEDEEVLQAHAAQDAEGDAAADTAAEQEVRPLDLDAQRLAAERAAGGRRGGAMVKRIGEGVAVQSGLGVSRLGVVGVLVWVGALVGAFFLLPWAQRAVRRAVGSPQKPKGGRDD